MATDPIKICEDLSQKWADTLERVFSVSDDAQKCCSTADAATTPTMAATEMAGGRLPIAPLAGFQMPDYAGDMKLAAPAMKAATGMIRPTRMGMPRRFYFLPDDGK